ncbi:MAG: squalene synthase HpnC [Phycisphaerales bacterium]
MVPDPHKPVMDALAAFGPGSMAAAPGPEEAMTYARALARAHSENFTVLSALVPPDLRDGFAAVYAFCRWADDLGDETGSTPEARARSIELLEWWRAETRACFEGRASHPVFVALRTAIDRHGLPISPFTDLIDAFVQDQSVRSYESWIQLLGYCRLSANPVGRLVLHLGGYPDTTANGDLYAMSDATCTALQLINFWQDVRRDLLERDRVYIPALDTGVTPPLLRNWVNRPDDHLVRLPYILAMRPLIERTRELFERGAGLPARLDQSISPVVWLFGAGGRAILQRVEQIGCATLWQRPRLSRLTKAGLVARAFVASRTGFGGLLGVPAPARALPARIGAAA